MQEERKTKELEPAELGKELNQDMYDQLAVSMTGEGSQWKSSHDFRQQHINRMVARRKNPQLAKLLTPIKALSFSEWLTVKEALTQNKPLEA